jgi:hypothetical protein
MVPPGKLACCGMDSIQGRSWSLMPDAVLRSQLAVRPRLVAPSAHGFAEATGCRSEGAHGERREDRGLLPAHGALRLRRRAEAANENDETIAQSALAVAAQGAVQRTVVRAFTEPEYQQLIKESP